MPAVPLGMGEAVRPEVRRFGGELVSDRKCLFCNESEGAIRESQRRRDPIFCAAVDYFGECLWERDRHRFADWTDRELIEGWRVLPEFVGLYHRIQSGYEIADAHRAPFPEAQDSGAAS